MTRFFEQSKMKLIKEIITFGRNFYKEFNKKRVGERFPVGWSCLNASLLKTLNRKEEDGIPSSCSQVKCKLVCGVVA